VPLPRGAAVVGGAHESVPAHIPVGPGHLPKPNAFGEHHGEQEDYLWGV